jgi:hypothetical protein
VSDRALLLAAIDVATGGNVSRFATLIGVSASRVFVWRREEDPPPLDSTVRRICEAMLADPAVAAALEATLPSPAPA